MRHFATLCIVRIILSAALFVFGLGNTVHAGEQEHRSVSEHDVWQHRPANMFKMSENKDPSVCDPLLRSLNEEKVITDQHPHPIIQNEFIINPWRRQEYNYTNVSTGYSWTRSWEVAHIDLDGDGVKDGLFRTSGSMKFNPYHGLMFVRSVDSSIVSKNSLSESEAAHIFNLQAEIYVNESYGKRRFPPSYIELINVNKKHYLMLFSAFYWARKTLSRYPFVNVLKRDATQFLQICHFEGIVKVMRGRPNWNQ